MDSSMSADDRYIAFDSSAALVRGDTNGGTDIYLRDRKTGQTRRISLTSGGGQTQGGFMHSGSGYPSISADGRYVAFASYATNLSAGDSNNDLDIFVRDVKAGTTRQVSVSSTGAHANGAATFDPPVISANGRYVAFASAASNLVPGDTNNAYDVFVRDLKTGTTRRVSLANNGAQPNNYSHFVTMSGNGRYVAFMSVATNMGPGSSSIYSPLYIRDLQTGTTRTLTNATFPAALNGTGQYLAYSGRAKPEQPGYGQIYLEDLNSGATQLVSASTSGTLSSRGGDEPGISADGRYVVFRSYGSDLVAGDTNQCGDRDGLHSCADIFVRDTHTGKTSRVNLSSTGAQTLYADSDAGAISPDGRFVTFSTPAGNLVTGDTNGIGDVFLRGPLH